METQHPRRLVCFGDSITAAEEVPTGQRWTDHLSTALPGWGVYNAGRGGATTSTAASEFESQVLPRLPAVVLIEFGFNDSTVREWTSLPRVSLLEYVRNLKMFSDAVSARDGTPVLLRNHTPLREHHMSGNGLSYNDNFALFDAALVRLAEQQRIRMIDIPSLVAAQGKSPANLVCEDGLHLSWEGNELYAVVVTEGLRSLGIVD